MLKIHKTHLLITKKMTTFADRLCPINKPDSLRPKLLAKSSLGDVKSNFLLIKHLTWIL